MSIIISDLQLTTSKRAISISYILIIDIILMKDSMVISDMLYILQHFNLNFIPFFIAHTVVFYNYCPTSPSRLLRKLWTSVKGNDWQINMEYVNVCGFWQYYHVLSKHWQPSCSILNVRMRRHGLGKRYLQE